MMSGPQPPPQAQPSFSMFMLHAEKREHATLKNWVWPGDEAKWTLQNVNFVHCAYKRIRSGSLDAGMPLINLLLSGSITTIVLEFGASKGLRRSL